MTTRQDPTLENGATETTGPTVSIRVKRPAESHQAESSPVANPSLNVHPVERGLSLLIGAMLLFWLGRRLLAVAALAGLAGFLIYRGLRGFCPLYELAQVNTAVARQNGAFGQGQSGAMEDPMARDLRHERQRDLVEEQSWESFPASDPPATASAT
jgi:hypothetical protein